jgi:hypothetical protein
LELQWETWLKKIVYVRVSLSGYETEVDLIPLELHGFDIILGMNW